MAWDFNTREGGYRGENTNLFKDFLDSVGAGVTGNTPLWRREEELRRLRESNVKADKSLASAKKKSSSSSKKSSSSQQNTGGSYYGGGGYVDTEAQRLAEEEAQRNKLRSRISSRSGDIDAIYNALFGDLESLIRARNAELDEQYGDQLKKASDEYSRFLPKIEDSYGALGAASSTDLRDANLDAQAGYNDTVSEIGKNKQKDQSALGQYRTESRAKFKADRSAARQAAKEAKDTTDVGALRGLAGDLDKNIRGAEVTRSTLGSDGDARKSILNMTKEGGRYDAAYGALQSVLEGSLPGDVKNAAIEAVSQAGGLSDDEKKKIQQQYGNVYSEQAGL